MRRRIVLLTGFLLLGGAGVATASPTTDGLDWAPCEEGSTVMCAPMTVPIDWDDRSLGTIDVIVARTEATGQKVGTLVYMPGGPGDSGVNRLLRGNVVPAAVAEKYDVVSYDPRGTNRSNPVVCDADLVANLPETVPDAGARLADVQEYARDLGESCRQHTGPLVDHVDNVSVAHDIDALRAELGERKVTLYGRSYGTLAGQMYAENFPHRVRGLVLDSVFDHSLPAREFLTTEASFAEDSFVEFEKWCAADASCVLHGQDVGQVYGELWERALRGELPMPAAALNQQLVNRFYGPAWANAATLLQSLADGARIAAQEEVTPFPLGAFCTDHKVRISSQREWESLWRDQKAAAPTVRTHFAWGAVSLCSAWPADTPNPQHRTRLDDDVPPVLIMNALHDPATGYGWAKSVHRQVGGALLTYDGWGHGVTDRNDCTRAVFTRYVLERKTPRPGTHCAV